MYRWLLLIVGCLASAAAADAQTPHDPSDAPLWHTAGRGRGMPAVSGDRAFALTTRHEVVALAIADGRELWRRSTREAGAITEGSRVVVSGDAVIVGDWDIYAFHAEHGAPLWEFHPVAGYAPGLFLGPVSDGRLFTGSPSGALYAVDAGSGRQLWRTVVEATGNDDTLTSVFAPVTNGAVVVAGYTRFSAPDLGGVVAVDAVTGGERWRLRFPVARDAAHGSSWAGGIAITRDLAIASAGDGTIWAVDIASGAVRWTIPPLAGPFDGIITVADRDLRGLAVSGDRLIVGSLTGYLTAYELTTRREVWRVAQGWLGSLSWSSFTVATGVAYVPWWSGFLLAIDVESGAVLWQTRDHLRGFSAPPAVAGDRVIATATSGFWALQAARPVAAGPTRAPAP